MFRLWTMTMRCQSSRWQVEIFQFIHDFPLMLRWELHFFLNCWSFLERLSRIWEEIGIFLQLQLKWKIRFWQRQKHSTDRLWRQQVSLIEERERERETDAIWFEKKRKKNSPACYNFLLNSFLLFLLQFLPQPMETNVEDNIHRLRLRLIDSVTNFQF